MEHEESEIELEEFLPRDLLDTCHRAYIAYERSERARRREGEALELARSTGRSEQACVVECMGREPTANMPDTLRANALDEIERWANSVICDLRHGVPLDAAIRSANADQEAFAMLDAEIDRVDRELTDRPGDRRLCAARETLIEMRSEEAPVRSPSRRTWESKAKCLALPRL